MVWRSRFIERENIVADRSILYSSLIIVISLQLRGRRQITEPRKYCLVRVIIFFCVFSLFFVSHRLGIRLNSFQIFYSPNYMNVKIGEKEYPNHITRRVYGEMVVLNVVKIYCMQCSKQVGYKIVRNRIS